MCIYIYIYIYYIYVACKSRAGLFRGIAQGGRMMESFTRFLVWFGVLHSLCTKLQSRTRMLPGCLQDFPGQIQDKSRTIRGHFQDISRTIPGHFQDNSRMLTRLSRTNPGQFQDISRTLPGPVQDISRTLPGYL